MADMDDTGAVRLLEEIRDLLKLIAEPQIRERERVGREMVRQIVGKSMKRRAAVLLIDGIRTRVQVQKEASIDQGDMSRLIAALVRAGVVTERDKVPQLKVDLDQSILEEEVP